MVNVENFSELYQAVREQQKEIIITRSFLAYYPLILPENTSLTGKRQGDDSLPMIAFQDSDGIGLTKNNTVRDLAIQAPVSSRALFLSNQGGDLGHFSFENLTLTGQFSFIMRTGSKTANLSLQNIDIVNADTRPFLE